MRGSDATCASLRRDGLRRLGAQRRRHGFIGEEAFVRRHGRRRHQAVASNYDTTYTSKCDLGGAVLLAVSETALRTARPSPSPSPRATPASTSTHAGHPLRQRHLERRHHRPRREQRLRYRAEARRGKRGGRPRDHDGHLRPVHRDHKLGRRPREECFPQRLDGVQQVALGRQRRAGVESDREHAQPGGEDYRGAFVEGVGAGTVDYVPIVMLCDTSAAREVRRGRAAVDAINKFDGYFDDLLPSRSWNRSQRIDGTQCKDDSPRTAWEDVSSGFEPWLPSGRVARRRGVGDVGLDRAWLENGMSTQ